MLLSDFNRDFGERYGITFTHPTGMKGVLTRTVFVIRPNGTLAYRWDNTDPPSLPKADDVLAALRAL